MPPEQKVCTFNCVYCQYGWTDPAVLGRTARVAFPAQETILLALAKQLLALQDPPDHLTFSGHGEATLHPGFSTLVDGVRRLRDRFAPAARTAILSNSSRVVDPVVRAALARLDDRIMKLDAGSQACLQRFNQPAPGTSLETTIEGLRVLGSVTLQSLFAAGPAGNLGDHDVARWLDAVARVAPVGVQLYTLDRPAPSAAVAPAPRSALETIAARVRRLKVATQVF